MSLDALRKSCCWLALLLAVATGVMLWQQSYFAEPTLPADLTKPGLAIELPHNSAEIQGVANSSTNEQTIRRLQIFDEWMFIPAYILFFGVLGLYSFRLLNAWTRWSGALVILCVIAAAFFDYREDWGILAALSQLHNNPQAAPIAEASYRKWGLLFLMLILLIPLLLRRWQSATLRVLGCVCSVYVLLNAAPGLVACFSGGREQIESSTPALAAPVVFFLFAALFHKSSLDGLNTIADLVIVRTLVSWPEMKQNPKTTER